MKKAYIKGYKNKGEPNPYAFDSKQFHQWEKGWISAYVDKEIDRKRKRGIPKSFS